LARSSSRFRSAAGWASRASALAARFVRPDEKHPETAASVSPRAFSLKGGPLPYARGKLVAATSSYLWSWDGSRPLQLARLSAAALRCIAVPKCSVGQSSVPTTATR
jgi:hypothetical protein